jgi:hypothetical protein
VTFTVWRAADHRRMRWQNGGGSTREVAGEPAGAALDAFDWRISVADVGEGGPFSRFEGVDRVLVLVDGPGMTLTVDGTRHELRRYEPFRFDGGAATTCELPGGPTRDVNVMTRRGRCTAVTEVLHPGAEGTVVSGGHPLVLLALAGPRERRSSWVTWTRCAVRGRPRSACTARERSPPSAWRRCSDLTYDTVPGGGVPPGWSTSDSAEAAVGTARRGSTTQVVAPRRAGGSLARLPVGAGPGEPPVATARPGEPDGGQAGPHPVEGHRVASGTSIPAG